MRQYYNKLQWTTGWYETIAIGNNIFIIFVVIEIKLGTYVRIKCFVLDKSNFVYSSIVWVSKL